MARLCGWLFLVMTAVVHLSFATFTHQREKRQSRPTVDCSRQKFKTHDSNCCPNSGKNIFLDTHLTACNPRRDRNLVKWANNYMLNSLQSFRKNNIVDISDPRTTNKICGAADFLNCVYESNGLLLSNGSINLAATIDHFSSLQNDDFWKATLFSGGTNFEPLVEKFLPMEVKYITCPGIKSGDHPRNVSAVAFLWTQIINGAFITQCPESSTANRCKVVTDNFIVCIKHVERYLLGREDSKELKTVFDAFTSKTEK
ncbi:uncharacterized protein LOC135934570 [Cloeon dipterum]|uniref:uncharacterized protein LOC135934570 n=1 Tax=Cloeon dipterum TaxID=197152 RepID=UPI0032201813